MTKLSIRTVNAAKPGDRDVFIWDSDLKGFGLKVTPSGSKIYVAQGRINGRPKRYTIGRHGSPWTPDQAREEAGDILHAMSKGEDPMEAKRKARADISVAELVDLYFREGCATKKASTIAVEKGLAERHIKPRLGKRMLKSLARDDFEKFLSDVAAGKTAADVKTKTRGRAIVKGGQGTANRALDLAASMLAFAVTRNLRQDNPTRGIRKFKPKVRERFLSPKELADLGTALQSALDEGTNRYAVEAIRLLLLTGCRKNEILTLRWDWVDTTHSVLRLPESKTGSKTVPLGAAALKLLADLPQEENSPFVFPSTTGRGHLVGIQKIWKSIRENAGLHEVRLHDLRHSYASVGASGGDSLYIIGKLLGHNQQRTTQRYAHLSEDPIKVAADRISEQIAAAMEGKSGNVIEFNGTGKPSA